MSSSRPGPRPCLCSKPRTCPGSRHTVDGSEVSALQDSLDRRAEVPSPRTWGLDEGFHSCVPISAAPSTGPGTPRSQATALTPGSWILGSVLASSVSLRILGQVL